MVTTEMDPDFARAVRSELTRTGTAGSALERHQRRIRTLAVGLSALALAGATTGAAVIVHNLPGTTSVETLGNAVSVTHTGTGTIELGPVPREADVVVIDLTCISDVGQVALLTTPVAGEGQTSAGAFCADLGHSMHVADGLLPSAGSTSITITADAGTTWQASAEYATSSSSDWGVNASGQTYGVPNGEGSPDLVAAVASNGSHGYVLVDEYLLLDVGHPIDVYESDGTTVIGQMFAERAADIPVDTSRIPITIDPAPASRDIPADDRG